MDGTTAFVFLFVFGAMGYAIWTLTRSREKQEKMVNEDRTSSYYGRGKEWGEETFGKKKD